MKQKIIIVNYEQLDEVNLLLDSGWEVVSISPFSQPVAVSSAYYTELHGKYGAYVLLQRKES